jgi:hypothetical protein
MKNHDSIFPCFTFAEYILYLYTRIIFFTSAHLIFPGSLFLSFRGMGSKRGGSPRKSWGVRGSGLGFPLGHPLALS